MTDEVGHHDMGVALDCRFFAADHPRTEGNISSGYCNGKTVLICFFIS